MICAPPSILKCLNQSESWRQLNFKVKGIFELALDNIERKELSLNELFSHRFEMSTIIKDRIGAIFNFRTPKNCLPSDYWLSVDQRRSCMAGQQTIADSIMVNELNVLKLANRFEAACIFVHFVILQTALACVFWPLAELQNFHFNIK